MSNPTTLQWFVSFSVGCWINPRLSFDHQFVWVPAFLSSPKQKQAYCKLYSLLIMTAVLKLANFTDDKMCKMTAWQAGVALLMYFDLQLDLKSQVRIVTYLSCILLLLLLSSSLSTHQSFLLKMWQLLLSTTKNSLKIGQQTWVGHVLILYGAAAPLRIKFKFVAHVCYFLC